MLLLFVLTVVTSACGQGIQVICGTGSAKRLSVALVVSEWGRYAVQYCRPAPRSTVQPPPAFWQWDLALKVVDQPRENCSYTRLGEKAPGKLHSQSFLNFTLEENCTYVCVSQNVDLLFRGCYSLQSKWAAATGQTSEPYNTFRYIDNDLTPEHFLNFTHWFRSDDYKNFTSTLWDIELPVTDYEVHLCNDTHQDECSSVTRNCTLTGANELRCPLQVPRGCYRLTLEHRAPWAAGSIFEDHVFVHGDFCHQGEATGVPAAGGARAVPWAWALVALAGAAAGAVLLRHKHVNAALKKHVLEAWTARGASQPACAPVVPPLEAVLLLHARDCPAVERFARALADLLREQLDVTVWDIYSPRVVSLSGAAPAEWLRAKLAAPRVRTVLLQTPALRLLAPAHEPAQPRALLVAVPTVEHFIAPLSYCLLADLCNHTWVPECGREFNTTNVRPFRDECDLLEYNCDYDREYEPTNYSDCFKPVFDCPPCKQNECLKPDHDNGKNNQPKGNEGKKDEDKNDKKDNQPKGNEGKKDEEKKDNQPEGNEGKKDQGKNDKEQKKDLRRVFSQHKPIPLIRRMLPLNRHLKQVTHLSSTEHQTVVLKRETVLKNGVKLLKVIKGVVGSDVKQRSRVTEATERGIW